MEKIIVDNILNGYNDFNKLINFYNELKKNILKEDPVHTSPKRTITLDRTFRNQGYFSEIYNNEEYFLILEAFGSWKGYEKPSPKINELPLEKIEITIFKDKNKKIKNSIENILLKSSEKPIN